MEEDFNPDTESSEEATPKLDPMSLRMAAANALIRQRRTVKPVELDSDKPIDHKHLATVLENANWAPSHGRTEPWRFVIFSEAGRQRLADFLQNLYTKLVPEDQVRPEKFEKLGAQPLMAPVVIAIVMKRQEIEKIPEIEEIEAVACAVQNMHLTASAMGMGGFWSSPPITYSDEMREWLGFEDPRDKCLGLFYLGWPKEGFEWPESERGSMIDKLTFVKS